MVIGGGCRLNCVFRFFSYAFDLFYLMVEVEDRIDVFVRILVVFEEAVRCCIL